MYHDCAYSPGAQFIAAVQESNLPIFDSLCLWDTLTTLSALDASLLRLVHLPRLRVATRTHGDWWTLTGRGDKLDMFRRNAGMLYQAITRDSESDTESDSDTDRLLIALTPKLLSRDGQNLTTAVQNILISVVCPSEKSFRQAPLPSVA